MTYSIRFDSEPPTADLAVLMGWTAAATAWGDLSVDQADGFASADDTDLPSADLNDDRGYGFGV